jgi:cytochrome P450
MVLTNTLSVSTAFALRNILRYPKAIAPLRERPSLLDSDNVILEFLRRDNHVKSLSRQVHSPFSVRGLALQPGDALSIFYPGVNLDPTHWPNPTQLDFSREFTRDNHAIFGGARYACIGSRIAMRYFKNVLSGMIATLPIGARVVEEDIETDSSWLTERIITRIPVVIP